MSVYIRRMIAVLTSLASVPLEWKVTTSMANDDHRIMVAHKNDVAFPDATPKTEQKGILAVFDLNSNYAMISTTYTSELEFYALIGIADFNSVVFEEWDNDIPF